MTKKFELVYRDNLRLVVFDVNDSRYDAKRILEHFESSEEYSDWWNHFPGVFIVRSSLRPAEINNDIGAEFSPAPSMICTNFNRENASARLGERAWRWILDMPDNILDPVFERVAENKKSESDVPSV